MNSIGTAPSHKRSFDSAATSTAIPSDKISIQRKKIKAKGADFLPTLPPLKSKHISVYLTRKQLFQKSGHLWKATGKEADAFGGNRIIFKLDEQFDDVTPSIERESKRTAAYRKINKIFPAIEIQASRILESDIEIGYDEIFKGLAPLGYECKRTNEGVFLYIPDLEALEIRWNKMREARSDLPELDILPFSGIADDLTFINAYLTHHAMLSVDKEFIHDHMAHIIPMLHLMLHSGLNGNPTYTEYRARSREKISRLLQQIQIAKIVMEGKKQFLSKNKMKQIETHIPHLEASLAAFIDVYSSRTEYVDIRDEEMVEIWGWSNFVNYFEKRFRNNYIGRTDLSNLWELLDKLEVEYKKSKGL